MLNLTPEQPFDSEVSAGTIAFVPMEPHLNDAQAVGGEIPLDRFWERQKFPPWLMAILAMFLFFLLFNVLGAIFMVGSLLIQSNGNALDLTNVEKLLKQDVMGQLVGNTIGQFLGLGIPALLLAKGHSSRWLDFLRIRSVDISTVLWSVLGLVAIYPLIAFSAELNALIPAPEVVQKMDKIREDFIMELLRKSNIWFNLFAVALTPAICEEILFRGYVQRQIERSMTPVWAIVITGTVFGLYHLSYAQALPLSLIGIYLCWLTWKTGSILPAVVVHFVNNGFSVVMATTLMHQKGFDPSKMEQLPLPWYGMLPLVLVGLLAFRYVMRRIHAKTPFSEHAPASVL